MMKNINLVALILLLVIFNACEKTSNVNKEEPQKIYKKEVTTKSLTNSFKQLQGNLKSNNMGLEFDNSHVYEVALDANSASLLMVNQIGYDENNPENFGFAAVQSEDGLVNPFIVKTQTISRNLVQIEYFNANFELIFSVELNSDTESINILYQQVDRKKDMGQDVADCLGDVYSNHGWISVWAAVQSAFIPQTAVALAGACVVANF
jgi:hypothetical protein